MRGGGRTRGTSYPSYRPQPRLLWRSRWPWVWRTRSSRTRRRRPSGCPRTAGTAAPHSPRRAGRCSWPSPRRQCGPAGVHRARRHQYTTLARPGTLCAARTCAPGMSRVCSVCARVRQSVWRVPEVSNYQTPVARLMVTDAMHQTETQDTDNDIHTAAQPHRHCQPRKHTVQ